MSDRPAAYAYLLNKKYELMLMGRAAASV